MAHTQDDRHIAITTPLGKDVLLLKRISGHEAMSRPFSYELDLLSEKNPAIDFNDIVGKNVTIRVTHRHGNRFINGIVRRFSQGAGEPPFASYRAELVPWLWLLTQTADCRIFQNMTVPDIIQKVFKDLGFADFKLNLAGKFQPREYCAQYRETDFNFVSRLMEQYGIFYFFEHADGKHTLVLGNTPAAELDCSPSDVRFQRPLGGVATSDDVVSQFTKEQEIRPAKYALSDYNFATPSVKLNVSVESVYPAATGVKFEVYDYPGEYQKREEGDELVRLRLEEDETQRSILNGASGCRQFTAGYKFQLGGHSRADLNAPYVLTSVTHTAEEHGYESANSGGAPSYSNSFTCIPAPVPFRAPRMTPRPVVQGSQTAEVVGPKDQEIWTDKYGRVKVQFHWDREGKKDENSSCWIRVSHPWAGKGWGSVSIPRIGQEVVIDFLEGDPDQPIITGRVYNGELMPPYTLPAGGVVSGVKSNSSKGGGGYNEISLDDTKGTEKIVIHGQYDLLTTIEHDRTESVGRDESITIGNNRTETVAKNEQVSVGEDRSDQIGRNDTLDVGKNLVINAGDSITIRTGDAIITMNKNGDIQIRGKNVKVDGSGKIQITASSEVNIKGSKVTTN